LQPKPKIKLLKLLTKRGILSRWPPSGLNVCLRALKVLPFYYLPLLIAKSYGVMGKEITGILISLVKVLKSRQ